MMHWLWYTLPLVALPGIERLMIDRPPALIDLPPVRRALAVAAHPDDLEYFCGGTIALLAQRGTQVTAALATRGEAGGDPMRREAEQREAIRLLGLQGLHWLGCGDRCVRADQGHLRERLVQVVARLQPDLLLTFDVTHPYPLYRHDDHMAVGEAVSAIWTGPTLLFHSRRPNVAVEISTVFPVKTAAFCAHRSQLPKRNAARLVAWHLGRRNAMGERRYAELFRQVGGES